MTAFQRITTSLALVAVLFIALKFIESCDVRDKILGYSVAIVYILIGFYYAYRALKRR